MKNLIKLIIKNLFPEFFIRLRTYNLLIKNKNSYLHTTGWMRSITTSKPSDEGGNPIPWMNLPVIAFLKDKLKDEHKLFEYGSGYSTFFYSKMVNTVTSVEYDEEWFNLIKGDLPSNAHLIFKAYDIDGEYCRAITTPITEFDVVVIDGRDRVNCLKQSIPMLSQKGVIILDDSQRSEYSEGIQFAIASGFRTLHFEGMKATGSGTDRTTIFYRNNNYFEI
jgi:hypothetical protein